MKRRHRDGGFDAGYDLYEFIIVGMDPGAQILRCRIVRFLISPHNLVFLCPIKSQACLLGIRYTLRVCSLYWNFVQVFLNHSTFIDITDSHTEIIDLHVKLIYKLQ